MRAVGVLVGEGLSRVVGTVAVTVDEFFPPPDIAEGRIDQNLDLGVGHIDQADGAVLDDRDDLFQARALGRFLAGDAEAGRIAQRAFHQGRNEHDHAEFDGADDHQDHQGGREGEFDQGRATQPMSIPDSPHTNAKYSRRRPYHP